jgi:hypothetical protein
MSVAEQRYQAVIGDGEQFTAAGGGVPTLQHLVDAVTVARDAG